MVSEAKKAAKARYDARTAFKVSLKLNMNPDGDLIDLLKQQPNIQGYLKELIRQDMRREK